MECVFCFQARQNTARIPFAAPKKVSSDELKRRYSSRASLSVDAAGEPPSLSYAGHCVFARVQGTTYPLWTWTWGKVFASIRPQNRKIILILACEQKYGPPEGGFEVSDFSNVKSY